MASVIQVRGLRKKYRDGTEALRGIDFDIAPGEIFGLLGPNGAGKTTTMRILGTLTRATGGTAQVLGHDVRRHAKQIRRRIGFAMQEVGMDDLATAREMLVMHARLYGIDRRLARTRTEEVLRQFELEEHADRRVTRFSGGMQRRLDLAVSIIHKPELLFLDEPSTGLDPKSREDLWQVLQQLRREEGITILMSTHYMDEADALCDRIAVISQGRVAAIDTPARLKRAVGHDTIQVRLAAPPDAATVGRLEARMDPRRLQYSGALLNIKVRDGTEALLPALRILDQCGLRIASTRVLSPTLNDAYLKYTGQELAA